MQGVGDPWKEPIAGRWDGEGAEFPRRPISGGDPADGRIGKLIVTLELNGDDTARMENPQALALVVVRGQDEARGAREIFMSRHFGRGLEEFDRLPSKAGQGVTGVPADVGRQGEDLTPWDRVLLQTSRPFQMDFVPVRVFHMELRAMSWKT